MSGIPGQAATVLFGRGIVRIAQLVAFLVLARALTPEEFGWFGILTTGLAFAGILGSLGFRQAFAYEIGQRRVSAGQAIGMSLAIAPVLALVSGGILFLAYGNRIEGLAAPIAATVLVVGSFATILHALLQGVFLGRGEVPAFSMSEAAPRVVLMVGTLTVPLFAALTLANALWLQVASFLMPIPLMIWWASRGAGRWGTAFRRTRAMMSYGLIFAVNIFLVTLTSRVSMFLIESISGPAAAGEYFAAIRINEIFLEAATAVGLVLFSHATRSRDSDLAVRRGAEVGALMFWLFLLLALPIALCAPWILRVLVGEQYASAGPVLQVIAFSLAPVAASKMIYPSIAGSGRPFFGTPVIFTSLLVNAAIAFWLVPIYGAVGGAIALAIGQYFLLIGYAVTCKVRYGLPILSVFVPRRELVVASLRTAWTSSQRIARRFFRR